MKFKFNFNDIANAISIASGVTLAGIIGVGTYVFVNKDAIIDDIKEEAVEAVLGGSLGSIGGGGFGGKTIPKMDPDQKDFGNLGAPDLKPSPAPDQASVPPQGPMLPVPSSPL